MLELKAGLTLYFSRHGETEANVEKRYQGQNTDTALTLHGLQQSRDVAKILCRELGARPRIEFVSSPLRRACITMEIVRETLGLSAAGYRTDPRLMEINLGAWDGLSDAEVAAREPLLLAQREADKWNVRVPGGGENYADVAARASAWIASLAADTFAVSHGAFTRILRGLFIGLDAAAMSALSEPQGVIFRVRGRDVVQLPSMSAALLNPKQMG